MKADNSGAYPSIAWAAAGAATTALAGSSGIWHYWRRRMPVEPSVLTDKARFPSEDLIFSHLGKQRAQWEALFGAITITFRKMRNVEDAKFLVALKTS